MATYRANRWQTFYILIRSFAFTAHISSLLLIKSYWSGLDRRYYDVMARRWSAGLLHLIKLNYRVHNPHQVQFNPQQRYIIMSNHASLYDIPLLFVAIPGSLRMVAKKELFRVPLWGRAMKVGEFPAIDRNNREQAIQDLALVKAKMETGIMPWISPEGQRSKTGELGQFKKGGFMLALQTGAIIVPVGIRGASDILPAKTLNLKIGGHADIYIGQPIDASQFEVEDRAQLMDLTRERILEAMRSVCEVELA